MWVVSTLREEKDLAGLRIAMMVPPAQVPHFAHGRTCGVHYSLLKPLHIADLLAVVRAAFRQEVPFRSLPLPSSFSLSLTLSVPLCRM